MNDIIPITVIDEFFIDPYEVRKYGLEVTKNTQTVNNITYRGKRSECLSEINSSLYKSIIQKIVSIFYSSKNEEDITLKVEIKYQLTDESFGNGWVHSDSGISLLTGIIYLNPDAPLDCGTSLYYPKKIGVTQLHEKIKKIANTDENLRKSSYYQQCREENNQQFKKILTANNIFNRLFLFDSNYYHCADRFFGKTKDDSRLTLVIWVHELYVKETPISRCRSIQNK